MKGTAAKETGTRPFQVNTFADDLDDVGLFFDLRGYRIT